MKARTQNKNCNLTLKYLIFNIKILTGKNSGRKTVALKFMLTELPGSPPVH